MTSQDYHRVFDVAVSRRTTLKAAAALGVGGSLLGTSLRQAAAQDTDYPEMVLTATDYAFDMPAAAESGYTRLTLDNQGAEDHHAIVFRLNEDSTPEAFQEALMSGDFGALLATGSAYGGPMASPGFQGSVIAFLDPGMYAVFCVVPDAQGVPHVAHGMLSMLEVTEGASTAADPVADASVSLVEMAFEGLPAEVAAGPHIWEVVNNGTQLHELGILQLAPGVSAEAALEMLFAMDGGGATPVAEAAPAATPVMAGPPFLSLTGAAPMSPGATNYAELDLVPGEYLALCFVPDAETGVPHALMGMVGSFTVA